MSTDTQAVDMSLASAVEPEQPRRTALTARSGSASPAFDVDIVIPVYNEEAALGPSVRRLTGYLTESFPFSWRITIADNASTDGTPAVAAALAAADPRVRVDRLEAKGRGRALRHAWMASEARVVAYMDVDLSTGLAALLPLVAPLISGHSDLAIGSRLADSSAVFRGPKRELISRSYNRLLRVVMRSRVTDAQCGFKAVRSDIAQVIVPLVEDDGWFFDTELLLLAERNELRIHEVPVDWVDDPDSRVEIVGTALADLRGVVRLLRSFASGGGRFRGGDVISDARRFARVGLPSTLAWLAVLLALRPVLGLAGANAVSITLCAAGNLIAHRRLARSRPDVVDYWRDLELVAGGSWCAGIGATTLVMEAMGHLTSSTLLAIAAAAVAGAIVSLGRFVLIRALVMRRRHG